MLVVDKSLIEEAGRRLASAAPGARVILFGSHARGEADSPGSGPGGLMADRMREEEGMLARSLPFDPLDDADPDASRITEILDGIPGAWERAQESIDQVRRGKTVPLSEL